MQTTFVPKIRQSKSPAESSDSLLFAFLIPLGQAGWGPNACLEFRIDLPRLGTMKPRKCRISSVRTFRKNASTQRLIFCGRSAFRLRLYACSHKTL